MGSGWRSGQTCVFKLGDTLIVRTASDQPEPAQGMEKLYAACLNDDNIAAQVSDDVLYLPQQLAELLSIMDIDEDGLHSMINEVSCRLATAGFTFLPPKNGEGKAFYLPKDYRDPKNGEFLFLFPRGCPDRYHCAWEHPPVTSRREHFSRSTHKYRGQYGSDFDQGSSTNGGCAMCRGLRHLNHRDTN